MSGDLVLVTGASGFVGSAVARTLHKAGYAVRVVARSSSPRTNLDTQNWEIVRGDMRDENDMRNAAQDARYIFHAAADYRLWARDPEEIVHNNREGTRCVMEAALACGAERVVYTSSVATLKPGDDGTPATEDARASEQTAIGAYKRSKVAAERLVEQMIAAHDLPAVIVSPSTPIGPRDIRPTPTGRIIVEAATGKMPAFVDTGLNLVHVDDVAAGHLAALTKGKIGETYILGGQDVSLAQMLGVIAKLSNRRAPKIELPVAPLFPLAYAAEAMARLTGREPFVTVDALKMARHRMFFSSEKAKRELGYTARPFEAALEDALNWFRENGYLA